MAVNSIEQASDYPVVDFKYSDTNCSNCLNLELSRILKGISARVFVLILLVLSVCYSPVIGQLMNVRQVIIPSKVNMTNPPDGKNLLSDFGSNPSIIPLETNADCLLGEQLVIIPRDNLILIWDKTEPPFDVYLFSKSGKFINKISKPGKGPFEYGYILGCSLSEEKKLIFLIDGVKNALIVFNLEGKPIQEIKFPRLTLGGRVLDLGSKFVLTYQEIIEGEIREGIIIVNNEFSVERKMGLVSRKDNPNNSGHFNMNKILSWNGVLLFSAFPYQTIYQIDPVKFTSRKYLEFSFSGYTNEQLETGSRELRMRVQDFKLFNNMIFIFCIVDHFGQYFLYNTEDLSLSGFSKDGKLKDDLFFLKDFTLSTVNINEAYDFVQPVEIVEKVKGKNVPNCVKSIGETLNENDNPIIRIVKIILPPD